jgi:hypothetical protein
MTTHSEKLNNVTRRARTSGVPEYSVSWNPRGVMASLLMLSNGTEPGCGNVRLTDRLEFCDSAIHFDVQKSIWRSLCEGDWGAFTSHLEILGMVSRTRSFTVATIEQFMKAFIMGNPTSRY